jgi:hypothetical protein
MISGPIDLKSESASKSKGWSMMSPENRFTLFGIMVQAVENRRLGITSGLNIVSQTAEIRPDSAG